MRGEAKRRCRNLVVNAIFVARDDSIIIRLAKIIREYEFPQDKYRNVPSPQEKYGNKKALWESLDLKNN
ncbi:hypothetical protein COZ84_00665 [Candidatus Kuenenbacteria bacterium CG_4_8_14_3_um_filter_39_15]|uniref:Uncharacterized protein n=1 Tax=Candidatus Kuenenbacteria bacterium CG_4_8_14_3_um_filter_39_15 TaxID=1974615 RepID=A0A2M7IMK5_9BACT|nr:MAG: hypothetical protein COZ84_00665 [Candidatus Kuenenbacteria bacterium CG_4_8_14_3_um_filter_39_15]